MLSVLMDLNLYCEYARTNNIKCSISNLLVDCNKHYIIKMIHDEIPTGKCMTFEEDYDTKLIRIILVNRVSLITEAFVLVELRCLYDTQLFKCSTENNSFAYLLFKN